MTDAFWIAFFAMIPPTIMAGAAFVASVRNGRKVEDIRKNTNGLVDERVKSAREEGRQDALREVDHDRRAREKPTQPGTLN